MFQVAKRWSGAGLVLGLGFALALVWMPGVAYAEGPSGPYGGYDDGKGSGHDMRVACIALHHVSEGETLAWIAADYGVSESSIAEANGLKDANLIYVDQELCIPAYGIKDDGKYGQDGNYGGGYQGHDDYGHDDYGHDGYGQDGYGHDGYQGQDGYYGRGDDYGHDGYKGDGGYDNGGYGKDGYGKDGYDNSGYGYRGNDGYGQQQGYGPQGGQYGPKDMRDGPYGYDGYGKDFGGKDYGYGEWDNGYGGYDGKKYFDEGYGDHSPYGYKQDGYQRDGYYPGGYDGKGYGQSYDHSGMKGHGMDQGSVRWGSADDHGYRD